MKQLREQYTKETGNQATIDGILTTSYAEWVLAKLFQSTVMDPKLPTNIEVYEWLSTQNFQTEYDENHEYKLYYELDMPQIIQAWMRDKLIIK